MASIISTQICSLITSMFILDICRGIFPQKSAPGPRWGHSPKTPRSNSPKCLIPPPILQVSRIDTGLNNCGRRGHENKLLNSRLCLDTRKFVFSDRVVDNWNSLSARLTAAPLIHLKSGYSDFFSLF